MEYDKVITEYFMFATQDLINFEYKPINLLLKLIEAYNQPHRFFHTLEHVYYILSRIDKDKDKFSEQEYKILILVALYHDYVYDPQSTSNEIDSADYFKEHFIDSPETRMAFNIIKDTKDRRMVDDLACQFHIYDFGALITGDFKEMVRCDKLIFKEYQYYDYSKYLEGRIDFLNKLNNGEFIYNDDHSKIAVQKQIEYLQVWRPNIGIYAGSFNPFHIGHMNIVEKAEKIFDKVIIVSAQNADKTVTQKYPLPVSLHYRQIKFLEPGQLLTDYIRTVDHYANATLIRGLRDGFDLSYEMNQLRFLEDLYPKLKTVNIICDKEYGHISSKNLRGLMSLNLDISKYLPR